MRCTGYEMAIYYYRNLNYPRPKSILSLYYILYLIYLFTVGNCLMYALCSISGQPKMGSQYKQLHSRKLLKLKLLLHPFQGHPKVLTMPPKKSHQPKKRKAPAAAPLPEDVPALGDTVPVADNGEEVGQGDAP